MSSAAKPSLDELDEGIRRVVRALWMAGLETLQSCEGGPDHLFKRPTVYFKAEPTAHEAQRKCADAIAALGLSGYTIYMVSEETWYQLDRFPWHEQPGIRRYMVLSFWGDERSDG